jgi:hypothetical protein
MLKDNDLSGRKGYDARGWTYGNRLDLIVEGNSSKSVTLIPMQWKHLEAMR